MADESLFSLFKSCKFTFIDKEFAQNFYLHKLLTNKLHFNIIRFDPLVIKKSNPSQEDICKLFGDVQEFLKVPQTLNVHKTEGNTVDNVSNDDHREPGAQSNEDEDSTYCKEIWMQHVLNNAQNMILTEKLEQNQVPILQKSVSDLSGLFCGMGYKENETIAETTNQKTQSDNTIDNDEEIFNEGINKLLSEEDTEHAKGFKKLITHEQSSIDPKKLSGGLNMHGRNQREMTNHDQENVKREIKNGKEECKKETTKQPSEQRLGDEVQNLEHCIDKIGKQTQNRQNETELDEMTPVLHESPGDFNTIEVSESAACNDTRHDHRLVVNKSDLKVYVYKASIIELETDCIVNAANTRLHHNGGVSNAIAGAAGPALTKECEEFINSSNSVGVTEIFVSTGGKLPSNYVIHAVGPKWSSYDDRVKCFEDLRHTVLRCLVEADRCKMTSIALPSISAAYFKVPKEDCARCYMEAVKHFHMFNAKETRTLREIHFVDIDDIMVNTIKECFFKGWSIPSNAETVQNDCTFAIKHLNSVCGKETLNYQIQPRDENKSSDHNKNTSLMLLTTRTAKVASSVESAQHSKASATYQIRKITLVVDVRPAFDQRADFTITIGQPFDKLSGLHDFQIPSSLERHKDMSYSKNVYQFVDVSKPGDKQPHLVCVVYPEPEDQDKVEEAFKNIEPAIQSFVQNMIALVLTSSILYAVPSNKQQQKYNESSIDKKKVEKFTQSMFDFLNKQSKATQENIHITVVGSEDAVLIIEKVLESCGVQKNATGTKQGSDSRAKSRRRSHSDHGCYSQGDTRTSSDCMQNSGIFEDRANQGSEREAESRKRSNSDYGSYLQRDACASSNYIQNTGIFEDSVKVYTSADRVSCSGADASELEHDSYSRGNAHTLFNDMQNFWYTEGRDFGNKWANIIASSIQIWTANKPK